MACKYFQSITVSLFFSILNSKRAKNPHVFPKNSIIICELSYNKCASVQPTNHAPQTTSPTPVLLPQNLHVIIMKIYNLSPWYPRLLHWALKFAGNHKRTWNSKTVYIISPTGYQDHPAPLRTTVGKYWYVSSEYFVNPAKHRAEKNVLYWFALWDKKCVTTG